MEHESESDPEIPSMMHDEEAKALQTVQWFFISTTTTTKKNVVIL